MATAEDPKFLQWLKKYSLSESGKWMGEFAWEKVGIKRLPFQKEGIVTAFYTLLGNQIYIADDTSDNVFFAILVHEMKHAHQRHMKGWLLYLLEKAFFRKNLEKEAEEQEIASIDWLCEEQMKEFKKMSTV